MGSSTASAERGKYENAVKRISLLFGSMGNTKKTATRKRGLHVREAQMGCGRCVGVGAKTILVLLVFYSVTSWIHIYKHTHIHSMFIYLTLYLYSFRRLLTLFGVYWGSLDGQNGAIYKKGASQAA
jgi:hypothetical protein